MLILQRVSMTNFATYGVLVDSLDWHPFATTIERPWVYNKPFVSCIPRGDYKCKRVIRAKHGECFEVQEVTDRSAILFHVANLPSDVQGCIGVGVGYGVVKGAPGIVSSTKGMKQFMERLEGQNYFNLKITEIEP